MAVNRLFPFAPGVAERGGAVEDGGLAGDVFFCIRDEVAHALELAGEAGRFGGERGFDFRGDGFDGVGIEDAQETTFGGIGIRDGEESVVEADFGIGGGGGIDPMDGGFADDAFGGVFAGGVWKEFGADEGNFSRVVFLEANALDDGAATEADVFVRGEAEVFLLGNFLEIVALDENFGREGDFALAEGFVLRVVGNYGGRRRFIGKVFDDDFQRIEHGHAAGCGGVELVADVVLQEGDVGGAVVFCDADVLTEMADGLGGVATAADAGDGGEAWVVPAGDVAFLHELEELALGHDRVGEAEAREFDLARGGGDWAVFDEPVVERAVVLKLKGAEGVCDVLLRVFKGVGEVIHGVDAPCAASVVVLAVHDAIHDGIAHVHVRGGQADFGTEDGFAFFEFPVAHFRELFEVFLDGAVAEFRRGAGCLDVAAVELDFLGAFLIDVGETVFDEVHGAIVEVFEVVACEVEVVAPVEAEPFHVFFDGVDVFGFLLFGIGVIEAEMAFSARVLAGDAEV